MPRKTALRDLPELRKLHPGHESGGADNRSERLLPLLRKTVEKVRQDKPITFYSMRQVAEFSGAPMKAVVSAFRRLQAEGQLTCVRGSRTLVAGRKRQPLRPIRGIVGLPVLLPVFATSEGWQTFFTSLEEELRRYDFVADFVFFQKDEDLSPVFSERLLRHQLDVVFWFVPPVGASQSIDQMRDAGVKIVIISNENRFFPAAQYSLDASQTAEVDIMKIWKRGGVGDVRLCVSPSESLLWAVDSGYGRMALGQGMRWKVERLTLGQIPSFAHSLAGESPVGLIFQDTAWFGSLWDAQPHVMRRLCTEGRVLLAGKCPDRSFASAAGVRVDVPASYFPAIAKRIASDISDGKAWSNAPQEPLRLSGIKRIPLF